MTELEHDGRERSVPRPKEPRHRCPVCDKGFWTRREGQRHIVRRHPDRVRTGPKSMQQTLDVEGDEP